MGYTTDFTGEFTLDKPLTSAHTAYLKQFSETRRMKRDEKVAATLPDPVREAVGLPVGPEGSYFVGGCGSFGQGYDESVVDSNTPPGQLKFGSGKWEDNEKLIRSGQCQPGLWCQWTPTELGDGIVWNGAEKFYHYVEWLKYLIEHFLKPWGYVLGGEVEWQGEDPADSGKIEVENNEVYVRNAMVTFSDRQKV